MGLSLFLLFLGCIFLVDGFGQNFLKMEELFREKELLRSKTLYAATNLPLPPENTLFQPLDHFNPQNKVTYPQRYWVNSRYWKAPHGPVFLYIGGEGALKADDAVTGALVKYARTHGALVFAVEHRFYGKSLNADGLELKNFQYLSSQQALADLATFHFHVSKSYNLTERNKWISFGGSYAGSLSAWFRIKYPHLVHGALASSAPVRALVNFKEFYAVVGRSFATKLVGGSKQCVDNIRAAFKTVDNLIKSNNSDNLVKLARDFRSCQIPQSFHDIYVFAQNIADFILKIAQRNIDNPSSYNIESIRGVCRSMTQPGDPYQNLVRLNRRFLQLTEQNCFNISWDNFMETFYSEDDWRPWKYQTCGEFGYYQTCDDTECPFSSFLSLAPNFDICETVYKVKMLEVYERIDFTNTYYGSDKPHGSRIIFVNGLIDPWHPLSVLEDRPESQISIVIPGVSHCVDLRSDSVFDPPALRAARRKISSIIGNWLAKE